MLVLLFSTLLIAEQPASDVRPCPRPAANESVLYSNDFRWGMSRADIAKKHDEIYASGKRLKDRAYYDSSLQSYILPSYTGPVRIDSTFLASVARHLEIAIERDYAEHVIFPDMGHSHLLVPDAHWERLKSVYPNDKLYEEMFRLRDLKILYHTAEQLRVRSGQRQDGPLPQDPFLLWRYFSRNVVGDNRGGENVYPLFSKDTNYNTAREVKGHFWYGAGFNVSASKDGCFAYRVNGKTLYFDLSLSDLVPDPAMPELGSKTKKEKSSRTAIVPEKH